MTITILTIVSIVCVLIGIFEFMVAQRTPNNELINSRCESIVLILFGIFIIMLAILFKVNPFW